MATHRRRLRRRGIARLELRVREDDVALVRSVAAALADPDRAIETRAILRAHFDPAASGLKALLAEAPLDGIDLERRRDPDRPVEL